MLIKEYSRSQSKQRNEEHRIVEAGTDLEQVTDPKSDNVSYTALFDRSVKKKEASRDPLGCDELNAPQFEHHIRAKGKSDASQDPRNGAFSEPAHQQESEIYRERK